LGYAGLVWSNLPWDWNLMGDMSAEGINGWGWGNETQNEAQINGDMQPHSENMGMPVL
jgi:hypothetical protein